MVVLLDLDEDGPDAAHSSNPLALSDHDRRRDKESDRLDVQPYGQPNAAIDSGFSRALACYP